jgi:hypothetical protein
VTPETPSRPHLADLPAPVLSAFAVQQYFQVLDRAHASGSDTRQSVLIGALDRLSQFGVWWVPDEADRREAERLAGPSRLRDLVGDDAA